MRPIISSVPVAVLVTALLTHGAVAQVLPGTKVPAEVRAAWRAHLETQRLERVEAPALLYEVHLDNGKEVVKLQRNARAPLDPRLTAPRQASPQ